jgi:flagellar hook-associated protein 1 FlgK
MSGLFGSLSSGVQAINSQAKALEVTSKNLANVNNPDYARQRVQFGDRGTVMTQFGAQSLGLEAIGVEHLRDALMDASVRREVSLSASWETQAQALAQAEATLGEEIDRSSDGTDLTSTSSGYGLTDSLNELFASFYRVANNPTDTGERQSLLTQADILTDRFNVTDERLSDLQESLTASLQTDVAKANTLLETIADLNGKIGRFEINNPGSAVDLRDQREAALEKLSGYLNVDVRVSAQNSSEVDVIAKGVDGSEISLITLAEVTAPLQAVNGTIAAGNPATDLDLVGGSLVGYQLARDGAIADLRADIDTLARELVTAINGIYNPTGTETNFFADTSVSAGTIRLEPGLRAATLRTSASGVSGANDLVTALGDLATKKFSVDNGDVIDGSLMDFYATTVTNLGNAVSGAESRSEDLKNIENLVRSQRDQASAVSLDEEMVNLMKYQRAFEASARVVQIVDEMLDVIVNRLGV